MNPPKVSLTPAQQTAVKQALRVLSDLTSVIPKARDCGVNCDVYIAQMDNLRKQLTAMQTHFMK